MYIIIDYCVTLQLALKYWRFETPATFIVQHSQQKYFFKKKKNFINKFSEIEENYREYSSFP